MIRNPKNLIRRHGAWAAAAAAASLAAASGWQAWDARAAVGPRESRAPFRLADELPAWRDTSPAVLEGSAETRLLGAYQLVGQQRLAAALETTRALVRAYPNFKLGLLLHADLLAAHAEPLSGFGSPNPGPDTAAAPAATEALRGLRDEARARLKALAQRPPAGAVPAEFVQLPASVSYAIAVDTSRSRLYLFRRGDAGLQLVRDFYVSVGKQGVDKRAEGDQRTPLGVYYTLGHVPAEQLDARFGAGALPLNYPNALDRHAGRTGSGILLHGVPVSTYSRPPQDSDGCVAMANEDLIGLAATLPGRDTPVVITREIQWIQPGQSASLPAGFNAAWTAWQSARLAGQPERLPALYAPQATLAADGKAAERFQRRLARAPASLDEVSLLTWRDHTPSIVVTFREKSAIAGKRDRMVRQYWQEQAGGWRIVAEGPVG
ncbi:L,D-transpeptidase family protein [Ideonella sp.]|uniref:L,D-transpeptidase family protein n=1 Tax=Ideonella sp. TaxID=1929293 RepID=UPI003BB69AFC